MKKYWFYIALVVSIVLGYMILDYTGDSFLAILPFTALMIFIVGVLYGISEASKREADED